MKSGNLNFLESSGPLQACNGTAFLIIIIIISVGPRYGTRLTSAFCCLAFRDGGYIYGKFVHPCLNLFMWSCNTPGKFPLLIQYGFSVMIAI
jgi:hypothetical protein